MKIFETASSLQESLETITGSIAFVPTMGALHAGHTALIQAARATHEHVVASIFVNPTQFNDANDLGAYPRTPAADAQLLQENDCHFLYLPSEADVYPHGYLDPTASLDFGPLVTTMEGANRPGHFAGVAQVVYRLLEIVKPTTLFLGQKDYQQVAVIRSMIKQLSLNIEVRSVPTVREEGGLALSSRNRLLKKGHRAAATTINLHLQAIVSCIRAGWDPRELEITALREMDRNQHLNPEYVSIFDGATLQPWQEGAEAEELVVATAVQCGPVRLIDNRIIRP